MAHYYVNMNAQANGDHEVHEAGCAWLPKPENRIYLGDYLLCATAVSKAREYYSQVNGCYFCSRACHTN